ncbi:pentatricopeptide repeat-containing protein At4g21300-like [Rutidosis leptorrhynchoides]|uniref:pentatricopeptide repeat-containing protein At4g21300-like n=1 Tax=Rutidosis leptorrhynchoides TaxID=125765 RepID=UPI003A99D60F
MYGRHLFFSFNRKYSQISSSIITNTPIAFHPYTKDELTSKLASVLQSCSNHNPNPQLIQHGQQIHSQIVVNGINHVGLLGSRLLQMYILCGKLNDAKTMFHQLDLFFASPWNWMIRGFTMMGCFDSAILVYFKMLGYGTCPDKYTFPYVIKACARLKAIDLGRYIHCNMIRVMGFDVDVYVGSSLIKLYAENGCIDDARHLFDKMPQRDDVLWNVILNGYLKVGNYEHVMLLFNEMRSSDIRPGPVTYACVLSACASDANLKLGTQVHGGIIKCGLVTDPHVVNTLIGVYAKSKKLFYARELFNDVQEVSSVTWNVIIGGHVQNGLMNEALDLLREMISVGTKPDTVTLASFLPCISESACINLGKEIHCYILRHDVHLDEYLKNALIDMYFKCRQVDMAHNVFKCSTDVDIVICTAMISGYVLNALNSDALDIFRRLLIQKMRPNAVTLSSSLPACAGLSALKLGKELHGQILKNGFEGRCHVGTAVTDMYAKCGRLDLAHQVFDKMPEKDSVCWNSMITSCCQNGQPEKAVDFFREMGAKGCKYDSVSISAALSAFSNLSLLGHGKAIHGFMIRGALKTDLYAESALLDMYAKCGKLESAINVFNLMKEKSEVSWNSIISAYGNHGRYHECLSLFEQMKGSGFDPDHVSFLAIISACDHAGLVDEGYNYFKSMINDYNIAPRMEHYACMIDLFGRAGRLNEAVDIIKSMPIEPDAGVWGTLLGACRVHGNVELAELACSHLFEMDPENSGYYMLLSNVQADAGKWEGVDKTRSLMKDRGVKKVHGFSWIEVNNDTHVFGAGETNNFRFDEINSLLKNFRLVVKNEGYNTSEINMT